MIRLLLAAFLALTIGIPAASWAVAQSSRDEPIPFGEAGTIGEWSIRVARVDFDAVDDVMAENQFNDPPEPGHRFVLARIEATYLGEETGNLFWDLSLKVVGESAVAFGQSDPGCGVVPDDLLSVPEVFPGGSVAGNACWSVPETDLDSLVLFAEPGLSFDQSREFFALLPPGGRTGDVVEAAEGRAASPGQIDAAQGAAPSDDRLGSRDNPIPLGQAARVEGWTIRVLDVDFDAADAVMAENQFNDPPQPGHAFVLATIEATLEEAEEDTGTFWIDMTLKVVGESAVAYGQSDPGCGVIPDELYNAPEVFEGGTISANTCWSVPETDIGTIAMFVEPSFNFGDEPPVFFSLRD